MQPFKPQFEGVISTDPQHGHEEGDVSVNGILVFLAVLAASTIFIFVFCYGMRIALNRFVEATNPTPNVWLQREQQEMAAQREKEFHAAPGKPVPTEAMVSQREMEQLAAKFPLPRLQTDDDIGEMQLMRHREDEMLSTYRWVDKAAGRVAIPIDQAMEMIAQRGLPTLGQNAQASPGTEAVPEVPPATTLGIARTSREVSQEAGPAATSGK